MILVALFGADFYFIYAYCEGACWAQRWAGTLKNAVTWILG